MEKEEENKRSHYTNINNNNFLKLNTKIKEAEQTKISLVNAP